jgi:hypothetical protein
MPDSEENPAGSSAQKSAFTPVDSDQFQIGTPKWLGELFQTGPVLDMARRQSTRG